MPRRDLDGNPKEKRAQFQNAYDLYTRGDAPMPTVRIHGDTTRLPRKTQPVAELLKKAWDEIDNDMKRAVISVEAIASRLKEGKTGSVICNIGRNTVALFEISLGEDGIPTVDMQHLTHAELETLTADRPLRLRDGTVIDYNRGIDPAVIEIDGIVVVGDKPSAYITQ